MTIKSVHVPRFPSKQKAACSPTCLGEGGAASPHTCASRLIFKTIQDNQGTIDAHFVIPYWVEAIFYMESEKYQGP